jgi:hypothetical protein
MIGDYGTKDALSGSLTVHFFSQEDIAMQPDWFKHYFTPKSRPSPRATAPGGQ